MVQDLTSSERKTGASIRAERYAVGKEARKKAPRSVYAGWSASPDRPDPIGMLEASNRSRLPQLVPIRYGRMAISAFTFLRGSAGIMAQDLAAIPVSGIRAQVCGDAHLNNFGLFSTPERKQIFDINDFDETLPGPWEWDVMRLATSIVVAGRQNNFTAEENRRAVLMCVQCYHQQMHEFATMGHLDIWYMHTDLPGMLRQATSNPQKDPSTASKPVKPSTNHQDFSNLIEMVNGQYRIKDQPPLIEHYDDPTTVEHLRATFEAYAANLPEELSSFLKRYRYVDLAQKVVGVGSVGTQCAIVLLLGDDDILDPLILQIKQAQASVLEPYVGASIYPNHAQRVVVGQRIMQAASDIFLGWSHLETEEYYLRQLHTTKWSAKVERMDLKTFTMYGQLCGTTLARAHARSGNSTQISGYLGTNTVFDQAIASFAEKYADQTERDHTALLAAIKEGRIQAITGV